MGSQAHGGVVGFHALQLGDIVTELLDGLYLLGQVLSLKEILQLKTIFLS